MVPTASTAPRGEILEGHGERQDQNRLAVVRVEQIRGDVQPADRRADQQAALHHPFGLVRARPYVPLDPGKPFVWLSGSVRAAQHGFASPTGSERLWRWGLHRLVRLAA